MMSFILGYSLGTLIWWFLFFKDTVPVNTYFGWHAVGMAITGTIYGLIML